MAENENSNIILKQVSVDFTGLAEINLDLKPVTVIEIKNITGQIQNKRKYVLNITVEVRSNWKVPETMYCSMVILNSIKNMGNNEICKMEVLRPNGQRSDFNFSYTFDIFDDKLLGKGNITVSMVVPADVIFIPKGESLEYDHSVNIICKTKTPSNNLEPVNRNTKFKMGQKIYMKAEYKAEIFKDSEYKCYLLVWENDKDSQGIQKLFTDKTFNESACVSIPLEDGKEWFWRIGCEYSETETEAIYFNYSFEEEKYDGFEYSYVVKLVHQSGRVIYLPFEYEFVQNVNRPSLASFVFTAISSYLGVFKLVINDLADDIESLLLDIVLLEKLANNQGAKVLGLKKIEFKKGANNLSASVLLLPTATANSWFVNLPYPYFVVGMISNELKFGFRFSFKDALRSFNHEIKDNPLTISWNTAQTNPRFDLKYSPAMGVPASLGEYFPWQNFYTYSAAPWNSKNTEWVECRMDSIGKMYPQVLSFKLEQKKVFTFTFPSQNPTRDEKASTVSTEFSISGRLNSIPDMVLPLTFRFYRCELLDKWENSLVFVMENQNVEIRNNSFYLDVNFLNQSNKSYNGKPYDLAQQFKYDRLDQAENKTALYSYIMTMQFSEKTGPVKNYLRFDNELNPSAFYDTNDTTGREYLFEHENGYRICSEVLPRIYSG